MHVLRSIQMLKVQRQLRAYNPVAARWCRRFACALLEKTPRYSVAKAGPAVEAVLHIAVLGLCEIF